MARKRKKIHELEDLGGSFDWTEDGITVFIPHELVDNWPAASVLFDEETESIIIQRED